MSSMEITPIKPISPTNSAFGVQTTSPSQSATGNFSKMLGDAINSLAETENNASDMMTRLAAGEEVDLHKVMIAAQEADIAFQVALQTRNKLVDAYQEIMRMQI